MPGKNNKKTTLVDATIAANPIKNMPMLIKELLSSKIGSQFGKKDGGSVQKKNNSKADLMPYIKGGRDKKSYGDSQIMPDIRGGRAKPFDKDIDYPNLMIKAGRDKSSIKGYKDGGKAAPVAKVKVERLKKMRDPYGESNFAHQISDGKDAYTQRVIAAMKESGQPFMYGGKVKKMRNGGSVNTTKSIQLNPKTGEPI